INHPPAFAWYLPTLLLLRIQRAQGVKIEKVSARFNAWAREDRDASFPVVLLVRVRVPLAAAAHGIYDKGRRVKARGVTTHILFDVESGLERSSQIFDTRHHIVEIDVIRVNVDI